MFQSILTPNNKSNDLYYSITQLCAFNLYGIISMMNRLFEKEMQLAQTYSCMFYLFCTEAMSWNKSELWKSCCSLSLFILLLLKKHFNIPSYLKTYKTKYISQIHAWIFLIHTFSSNNTCIPTQTQTFGKCLVFTCWRVWVMH